MSAYFQSVFERVMEFKPATWGMIITLVALAIVFLLFRKKWDTRMLTYGAICIAIAFVLSYIRIWRMPQGGSITPASMFPIMLFAWVFGPRAGISAAVIYGAMQLFQDFYVVHLLSLVMDYILAFACLGLTGFFKKNITLGIVVACVGRWFWHTLSGYIFFAEYTWAGWNPLLYSIVYNFLVVGAEGLVCIVVSQIPRVRSFARETQVKFAAKKAQKKAPATAPAEQSS
jgi:thiamine transporter